MWKGSDPVPSTGALLVVPSRHLDLWGFRRRKATRMTLACAYSSLRKVDVVGRIAVLYHGTGPHRYHGFARNRLEGLSACIDVDVFGNELTFDSAIKLNFY